jgi:S1-C subfamily serine protease
MADVTTTNPYGAPAYGQGPPPPPPQAEPVKTGHGKYYLLGFIIGLILAVAFAVIFYKYYYPILLERQALAELNVVELQGENIRALETEINRYKSALGGDVCTAAPLENSLPLFKDPAPPEGSGLPPLDNVEPEFPDRGEEIENSTVFVVDAASGSMGSGFFIADRLVLTNRHVVEDAITTGKADGIFINNRNMGKAHPAKIRAFSSQGKNNPYQSDLAVLEVMDDPGPHQPLKFAQGDIKRAERVASYGSPGFIIKTDPNYQQLIQGAMNSAPDVVYSEGVVSVVQDYKGSTMVNHTAQLAKGNSGGPLLNERGNVVGINTMINIDNESNSQSQLAQGNSSILRFLGENNISFQTGS